MDFSLFQKIADGVVEASAACDGQLFTGTVTNNNPLKITLGEDSGGIELDGDDIILTQAVVSKKLYIKKHDHNESEELVSIASAETVDAKAVKFTFSDGTMNTSVTLKHNHDIYTNTLEAWVTEYGYKLPVDPEEHKEDGEQVVITINRGLEKGDKVIMTRVSHGQQFIVLSRYFEVDKQGDADNQQEGDN